MKLAPVFAVLLAVSGLFRVHIAGAEDVEIVCYEGNEKVCRTLSEEESKAIVNILDRKIMWPMAGEPACGFGLWGAVSIDGVVYEPAFCCGSVWNDRNERYIFLTEKEMEVFRTIMAENTSYSQVQ